MSSSTDTARAISEVLLGADISGIVVSPGSRNTPLTLMLDAHFNDRVTVVLDERAAAFVAIGMARATGRPAVLLCTSGSAGSHYLPALLEARYGRVPIIAITADRPAELKHVGAPQTIAQTRLFGEHVLATREIPANSEARWVRVVTAQLVAQSMGSPVGPVHLNVGFREPLYEAGADSLPISEAGPRIERGVLFPTPAQIDSLDSCLAAARNRGLIVCGPLAPATLQPRAFANAIHALSQHLGWPVIAEPASGLRFADIDPTLLITDANALLRHPSTRELLQPACVLQFGQNPTSNIVSQWLGALPADCERVMVDPDGMWHDPHTSASKLMVCDPIALCQALYGRISKRAGGAAWPPTTTATDWTRAWLERAAVAREVLSQHTREGLWEGRVAAELARALPRHSQLWTASSMPVRDVDHFAGARQEDLAVRASRGTNGIDGTIASAIGAARVWPHGSTVALLGDLAFLHDLGGLQAAAQLDAPLTLVVINNGGGGIFSFLPIAALESSRFERLFLTPQSCDISQVCSAVGAMHERVSEASALGAALDRHIGHGGLRVVEVMVDRTDNVRRHERAWAHVKRALDEVSGAHIESPPNTTATVVPEGPS